MILIYEFYSCRSSSHIIRSVMLKSYFSVEPNLNTCTEVLDGFWCFCRIVSHGWTLNTVWTLWLMQNPLKDEKVWDYKTVTKLCSANRIKRCSDLSAWPGVYSETDRRCPLPTLWRFICQENTRGFLIYAELQCNKQMWIYYCGVNLHHNQITVPMTTCHLQQLQCNLFTDSFNHVCITMPVWFALESSDSLFYTFPLHLIHVKSNCCSQTWCDWMAYPS